MLQLLSIEEVSQHLLQVSAAAVELQLLLLFCKAESHIYLLPIPSSCIQHAAALISNVTYSSACICPTT